MSDAIDALVGVQKQLIRAGATLPAPAPTGTIESAMNIGLCIALALVESAIADLCILKVKP